MTALESVLPVRPIVRGGEIITYRAGQRIRIANLTSPKDALRLARMRIGADEAAWGYAIGMVYIAHDGDYFHAVRPGQVFELDGAGSIEAEHAFVVAQAGPRGIFTVKGPIEGAGRLRYIDGCSDTLLLGPHRKGEACLNHLHFPTGIKQTRHTHPSLRAGVIARGEGTAFNGDPENDVLLEQGVVWWMPPDCDHAFRTGERLMDVVAWHPDSDTGPSDEDHPMLNRTIVDGVSARNWYEIRTQEIRE